ncbi:MAG TPA: hypothetical protein VG267_04305 [Terracidiphilus sp.]|jgi:hypothetical protein|nr:hypothetical protein [Terracidiphilus sp.]
MQLVIRVELDKARQSLPEVFRLIGDCRRSDEIEEEATAGAAGLIKDDGSHVIGEWDIEEPEEPSHTLESSYRAVAAAKYVQPKQIEIDRFATVSLTDDGAYVQGWLFVPQADVATASEEPAVSRKPPQSVVPMRNRGAQAG